MKSTILSFLLLAAAGFSASAATISQWTFETSVPTAAGSHIAEGGVSPGSALGSHAAPATAYSNPFGNGSTESFSANNWLVGDYWQFQVDTTGYEDISLDWDQTSSSTGPMNFKLQYSATGVGFTDFATYTVLENISANGGVWSATTDRPNYSFSMDLSAVGAIENTATVFFRLVDASTTSANGATVAGAGASRIDNFTVTGEAIAHVPDSAPGWLGLGAVVAMMALGWRRSELKVS